MHTCIYTYIHTYIYTYIHTGPTANSAMDYTAPEGPTVVLTCFDSEDKMLQRVRVSVHQKWSDMEELAMKSKYVFVHVCMFVCVYVECMCLRVSVPLWTSSP